MKTRFERFWNSLTDEQKQRHPTLIGFGDLIESVTKTMKIPTCEGCKKRRDYLNEKFPFKKIDDRRTHDDREDIRQP